MDIKAIFEAIALFTVVASLGGFAAGYRCGQLNERDEWREKLRSGGRA